MKYDESRVNSAVSSLSGVKSKINSAASTIDGIQIPEGFKNGGALKALPGKLRASLNGIGNVGTSIKNLGVQIRSAESNSSSAIEELFTKGMDPFEGESNKNRKDGDIKQSRVFEKDGLMYRTRYQYVDGKLEEWEELTGYAKGEYDPWTIKYKTVNGNLYEELYKNGKLQHRELIEKESITGKDIFKFVADSTKDGIEGAKKWITGFVTEHIADTNGMKELMEKYGTYDLITGSSKGASVWVSIINSVKSIEKGVPLHGESLLDSAQISLTSLADYLMKKQLRGMWGKEESNAVWKNTMESVQNPIVESAYAAYYNTAQGKSLDNHAFSLFKSNGAIYQLGTMVGRVLANIGTTMSTGGSSLLMSLMAGSSEYGIRTEEYWTQAKENVNGGEWTTEENRKKGVNYGKLNAVWETVRWLVGGKLTNSGKGLAPTFMRAATNGTIGASKISYMAWAKALVNGTDYDMEFEKIGGRKAQENAFISTGSISFIMDVLFGNTFSISKETRGVKVGDDVAEENIIGEWVINDDGTTTFILKDGVGQEYGNSKAELMSISDTKNTLTGVNSQNIFKTNAFLTKLGNIIMSNSLSGGYKDNGYTIATINNMNGLGKGIEGIKNYLIKMYVDNTKNLLDSKKKQFTEVKKIGTRRG